MDAKLRLAVLAGLGLAHSAAFGLGLGNVEVVSHLNEPLEARIELLSTTSKELADAKVSIAPEADFSRVGLERSAFLNRLNFTIISDEDRPYVQVTTQAPVQEPFLDFLVVVDFSAGKLLREYTLLLDPPVFTPGNTTSMQTSASEPEEQYQQMDDGSTQLSMDKESTYSEPEAEYQAEAEAEPEQQTESFDNQNDYGSSTSLDDYTVQAGDTLWEIARDTKPTDSVTINQMMVALLRANPEAFYDDNINALKKGAVMRVPDSNEVNETSHADAVAMVRNQNAMWENYRSEMAEQAPTVSDDSYSSSYDDNTSSYQESESHLELVPPKQSDDSVDTSVAQASGGYNADNTANTEQLEDDLARSQEQLVAKDQEAAELRSRISDLEDLVDRLETAVSIKDSDLSELQNQLASAQQAIEEAQAQSSENAQQIADDAESSMDELSSEDETSIPTDTSESTEDYYSEQSQADESNAEDMAENTDMAVDDTETPADDEYASQEDEFSFNDAENTENTENIDSVDQEPEQTVVEEEAIAEQQPPAEQPKGFMDWLTHPYAYGLYGLLAILGLLGFMRSRKKDDDDSDIGAFAGEIESEVEKAEESVENIIDDVDEALESGNEEVQEKIESLENQAEELAEEIPGAPPELDFDTLDEAAEDIAEAANEEEPAEFDLGDLYAEEETADDKQESNDDSLDLANDNESDETDGGLDFDLDMDLELEDEENQSDEDTSTEQVTDESEEDQGISFDLESMIENEDDAATPEEEVELPTFAMDAETDDKADSEDHDSLELNLEDDSFELDLEDLEKDSEEKAESSEEASEFDLEMTEDLTELAEEPETDEPAESEQDKSSNEIEKESPLSDDEEIDEPPELDTDDLFAGEDAVATKLDLARAYMDMGDPDGARGMLEEVIAEGNDSQKSEAEQLLADI